MNAGLAYTMESLFGPPSELIDISAFILSAAEVYSRNLPLCSGPNSDSQTHEMQDNAIALECSVSDLRDSLYQTWNNPRLSSHLSKVHEHRITSLYGTAKATKQRRKERLPDPDSLAPDVVLLQSSLDNIQLATWKLQAEPALFMRSSKISDQNVLSQIKTASGSSYSPTDPQAIITISIYNRLTWSAGYVTRASQHALLSSQTLGDLFEVIPCTSNELATAVEETNQHGETMTNNRGCVFCIEDIAYGDGLTDIDYADKLLLHLKTISKDSPAITKAASSIYDTSLASLLLRINHPYWLLHQGNCEHFVIVDQIRLRHPSDALTGYPLTLQITPPLLDLCRVCMKVPAVLSVVGDVRAGESPCLMCGPCWRAMGDSPDPGVLVKLLPKYESGH